jgi:hypothetical protein
MMCSDPNPHSPLFFLSRSRVLSLSLNPTSPFHSPLALFRPGGEGRRSAMAGAGGFITWAFNAMLKECSASRGGPASRGRARKRGTTDACSVLAPECMCAGPFQQRDTMATRARPSQRSRDPHHCRPHLKFQPRISAAVGACHQIGTWWCRSSILAEQFLAQHQVMHLLLRGTYTCPVAIFISETRLVVMAWVGAFSSGP